MKNLISLIIPVVTSILFITYSCKSSDGVGDPHGGNPHDSLLFDAGDNFIPVSYRTCNVTVHYVSGDAHGKVEHIKISSVCGVPDTVMFVKAEELKTGDVLHIGDSVTTGDNSYLSLEFEDGSEARIGPNSVLRIYQDFCENGTIGFYTGKFWTNVKHALGGAKYEVKTSRAVIGHRGTAYSITSTPDQEIFTVYEGSIDVKINKIKFDKGEKLKQLAKDFKDGKITQQEFMEKTKEYTNFDPNSLKVTVTVEAGNYCTAGDLLSDPMPIGSDDDRWFETNFK